MRTLTQVAAKAPHILAVRWSDGTRAELNMSGLMETKAYAPLREEQVFAKAALGDWGHSVVWPGDIESGADSLWRLTLEATGRTDTLDFLDWRTRHGLSLSEAAQALGISRRMVAYYSSGEREVPRTVLLACFTYSKVFSMKHLRYKFGPLDRVDAKILRLLVADARLSLAALAREVGMSAPSVSERLKRLEEEGVIESYTAVMSPKAIGLPISAYIRVQPVPGKSKKVLEVVESLPEVVRCDRVTGGDCYIARVHVEAVSDLERLVDELAPFAMTDTSVIQSTPVPYRLPPFPVAD